MFPMRSFMLFVVGLIAAAVLALGAPLPTSGARVETRYVVRPGDTLWVLASERYGGDPREAVWRIKERNGLASSSLLPGQVLALPP